MTQWFWNIIPGFFNSLTIWTSNNTRDSIYMNKLHIYEYNFILKVNRWHNDFEILCLAFWIFWLYKLVITQKTWFTWTDYIFMNKNFTLWINQWYNDSKILCLTFSISCLYELVIIQETRFTWTNYTFMNTILFWKSISDTMILKFCAWLCQTSGYMS